VEPSQYRDRMLSWLARLNPTAVFLVGVAFVLVALFAPGVVGGALLLLLAVALAALAVTTWPVQRPATRVLRIAVPLLLVVAAVSKMT
jgi:energy-coupling factor transporter transmembrane protein EcfT